MKNATCAHPACDCPVPESGAFCSDACRELDAAASGPCTCGHSGCGSDPIRAYETPEELLGAVGLSSDQKLTLLRRWRFDAEALEQAADEGMTGGTPSMLQRVVRAIEALEESADSER